MFWGIGDTSQEHYEYATGKRRAQRWRRVAATAIGGVR
jgi:hypothetical protein